MSDMVLNKIDSIRESVELQTNVNHDAVLRKSTFSEDNEMLSRTGKKPVLKVRNLSDDMKEYHRAVH